VPLKFHQNHLLHQNYCHPHRDLQRVTPSNLDYAYLQATHYTANQACAIPGRASSLQDHTGLHDLADLLKKAHPVHWHHFEALTPFYN
jgi:hypothetical protein